jgi:transposase
VEKEFNPEHKKAAMQPHQLQNFKAEFDKEKVKALYPKNHIPKNFYKWLRAALQFEAAPFLQITYEEFKIMRGAEPNLNLYLMGIAINSISAKTPDQLKDFNYDEVQEAINKMALTWTTTIHDIRDKVVEKLTKEMEQQAQNQANQMEETEGVSPLPRIVPQGEA